MNSERVKQLLTEATGGPWQYDELSATVRTREFDPVCEVVTSDDDGDLIAAAHEIALWGLAQSAALARTREQLERLRSAGDAIVVECEKYIPPAEPHALPDASMSTAESILHWRALVVSAFTSELEQG